MAKSIISVEGKEFDITGMSRKEVKALLAESGYTARFSEGEPRLIPVSRKLDHKPLKGLFIVLMWDFIKD